MTILRLIKENRGLQKLTIMLVFGWFFLIGVSSFVFFSNINENSDYELEQLLTHYDTAFNDYNDRLLLVSAYFSEHADIIDNAEYERVIESVMDGNPSITAISLAPSGRIEFIYPNKYNDQLGFDIMLHATISENSDMLEAIEDKAILYQYVKVDDQVTQILIRNPIFVDDEFYGFVTMLIDQKEFATASFTHTSEFLNSAIYSDNLSYIYGSKDSKRYEYHELEFDGTTIIIGESIKLDYLMNRTSYLVGYALSISLLMLITFLMLYKVFANLKSSEEELEYKKFYDSETNLFNIDKLYFDVGELIDSKTQFYLSFLNINNVKAINHKFGHHLTSALLKKTAAMIVRVLRNNSTLYRYGGDEYVLITKTDSVSEIKNLLRRIIKIFESDIVSDNIRTRLGTVIGVAEYPLNGKSTEELIKNAHITALQVSNYDKEGFQFFKSDLINKKMDNEAFDKLVTSLNLELFEVYLMPIVHVDTNQIAGFECLTRAFDDLGKSLPTQEVVLSLEQHGKIQILDEIVFKKMLAIMKRINKEYPEQDYFLSLNASALSLNDEYVDNVIRYYKNAKLKKGQIVLELTESYQVEDYDHLIELFKRLNAEGIKIGIDDFGSGYSSISYLAKFPVYAIKIDKEFVKDYHISDFNKTLLMTLKSIAEVLKCKLVAEGVDSPDTLEYLKEYQCPFYQGYLFSKGVPFDDAMALIAKNINENKG